ncbi:unnamed protein product [Prorocentrum cordatum]|uniref:Uncharacterized protein n=1 Tax=Prorocentrum cordatum TaxID=2364126 RepID=A0ABN9QBH0_9DINO|nr:unnamed protein product [Polarella glacialis]
MPWLQEAALAGLPRSGTAAQPLLRWRARGRPPRAPRPGTPALAAAGNQSIPELAAPELGRCLWPSATVFPRAVAARPGSEPTDIEGEGGALGGLAPALAAPCQAEVGTFCSSENLYRLDARAPPHPYGAAQPPLWAAVGRSGSSTHKGDPPPE